jgi:serine protease Do
MKVGRWIVLFVFLVSVSLYAKQDKNPVEKLQKVVEEVSKKVVPAFVFMGNGSGVIISADGYFLKNAHVANSLPNLKTHTITLNNSKRLKADRIGCDPQGDIALFKIRDAKDLPFVPIGDSDKLEVGEYVIAVGDPFGASIVSPKKDEKYPTVTLGIVSALHRYEGTYTDAIQTDAPVNPGNSGGPLVTLNGELVGIVGKIRTRFGTRVNTGVGLAIPINQVKRFLEPLKKCGEGGTVYHGTIDGLSISPRHTDGEGAVVSSVKEGSPAEKAGFKKEDVIVQLDNYKITSRDRFFGALGTYPEMYKLSVKVKRGDQEKSISVSLDRDKGRFLSDYAPDYPARREGGGYLGIAVLEDESSRGKMVMIESVAADSPAERAGLMTGDIILQIDQTQVRSLKSLFKELEEKESGDEITLTVARMMEMPRPIRITLGDFPKREEREY